MPLKEWFSSQNGLAEPIRRGNRPICVTIFRPHPNYIYFGPVKAIDNGLNKTLQR
jgi:hypothetical protein